MEPFVIGYLRLLLLFFCSFNATSFEIGVTHTHDDVSEWSDPASADRAKRLLSNRVIRFQNQHIMGWGADNPQPAPGYYNWTSLDARIEMIRQTNGTGVLALCCAPDWMKGGQANTTDWSKIAVAPLAEHYKDFAALASRVAERYPDIAHFQVWNELKGFWNQSANRWAYDNYTTMYNLVHAAVKRVRPDAIIGGPYVPFGNLLPPGTPSPVMGPWGSINPNSLDAVAYWLEHKVAADFVCVDGHAAFNQTTGDPIPDPFVATQVFSALNLWLRNLTDLPIWWSEIYPLPSAAETWALDLQTQVFTYAMRQASMADVVLTWPGQGSIAQHWTRGTMWNDTSVPNGGYPTPFYQVAKAFNNLTDE